MPETTERIAGSPFDQACPFSRCVCAMPARARSMVLGRLPASARYREVDVSDATGGLVSSTVCFHQGVDVYYDTLFGSYLFNPTDNGSASCSDTPSFSGVVTDAFGNPVKNQRVQITMPDGSRMLAATNARGTYKFYNATSARTAISVAPGLVVTELTGAPPPPTWDCNGAICRPAEQ